MARKSNKEAMQASRARMKQDPEKHQAYLKKEKERYQQRKAAGKILNIKTLSDREKRQLRKKWREEKRKQRAATEEREENTANTPPASPRHEADVDEVPQVSAQKIRGRKKMRKEDRKAYRTIAKQANQIQRYQNKIRVLQRKLKRTTLTNATTVTASPATKATNLVESAGVNAIRRELTFHYALQSSIKTKLKENAKTHKQKMIMHNVIVGPIFRKYGLMHKVHHDLNLPRKTRKVSENILEYNRKERNPVKEEKLIAEKFFLEDATSTPTAGKKETVTRKKDKRQKRYLVDTMQNLYKIFRAENPRCKVSYTTFTRCRPFYVVPPSIDNRDTVKCKSHGNIEMKAVKLHKAGVLKSAYLSNIISEVVCSQKSQPCMYRTCNACQRNIHNIYKDEAKKESMEIVTYFEWNKQKDVRRTNKGEIEVSQVTKIEKTSTIADLCVTFEKGLIDIMAHQYWISHQFDAIRSIKDKLSPREVVLQVDFSENYACKGHTEIQSMHFGGSRNQVTIHTCHATLADESKCYATLSEDCRHSPLSIWAHLDPVIQDLREAGIDTLHIVSDGPTTQYRNKTNFQLMATHAFEKYKISHLTWTLLEAGHGKGPADGIGAALKGAADRMVAGGRDILSCTQMFEALQATSKVKLFQIRSEQIDEMADVVNNAEQMHAIRGTMEIHQLIVPVQGDLYHRKLACFCDDTTTAHFCSCHTPMKVVLPCSKRTLKPPPIKSSASAVERMESTLTENQLLLFRRRLEEGYDVSVEDLTTLDEGKKAEYLLWKTWRAAKLNEAPTLDDSSDSEPEDGDDDKELDDLWLPPRQNSSKALEVGKYYAVFFIQRRKKTYYIGCPVSSSDSDQIEMKFFEKKLVGSSFVYDWPKRPDVCVIDRSAVLQQVIFNGPPPYHLQEELINKLNEKAKGYKLK